MTEKIKPYIHSSYRKRRAGRYAAVSVMLCLICVLFVSAATASAQTMVSDSAGYLSTEEAYQIEDTCDKILQQYNTSVFIITTDKLGKSDDYTKYLDEQAEKVNGTENLVILFISTKEKDGICKVTCHGKIREQLTENRIEKMTAAVQSSVDSGKHYQAIDRFCDDVNQSLAIKPSLDGLIFQSVPQLLFSLLVGCGVIYYLLRPAKKKVSDYSTYLDSSHPSDLGHLDHFSHKEVNILKTKKKSE